MSVNNVEFTVRFQAHPYFGSRLALMRIAFLVLAVFTSSPSAEAVDWLTLPSRYTHNPSTGERISQYRKIQAPSVSQPANFRTSGYTHTRSSLNYGQSADNYHRVEQWGDPVRPYGEWRFPFSPYSTPYPNWGPPYAGLNIGGGYYGPFGPVPYGPYWGAGMNSGNSNPGNQYPAPGTPSQGAFMAPDSGASMNPTASPGAADGLLPPSVSMSVVPTQDGVGMPVGGMRPEGEMSATSNGFQGRQNAAARRSQNANGIANQWPGSAGRPQYRDGFRGRYRPNPQPSPFNPCPSGAGTPYPVAPYYDGYYPVYRD